jgi:hypothetical protein
MSQIQIDNGSNAMNSGADNSRTRRERSPAAYTVMALTIAQGSDGSRASHFATTSAV